MVSGKNLGHQYAVFEPGMRTTGMDIAGKHVANPITMFNASAAMLDFMGFNEHATHIRTAIDEVIFKHNLRTKDMGGESTSEEVVEKIIEHFNS